MSLIGLSNPRAVTAIPDPIHKRIDLTIFERDLVDTQDFQRLHFIFQNAVNYTSFPSNKSTKFPHTLGVAHVSGALFSRGVSNASFDDLDCFLKQGAAFIEHSIDQIFNDTGLRLGKDKRSIHKKLSNAHFHTISGSSLFLHTPLGRQSTDQRVDTEKLYGKHNFTASFIVDTLWQAVRLYSLMHDLGHLPMSHAFEDGFDDIELCSDMYEGIPVKREEIAHLRENSLYSFTSLSFDGENGDTEKMTEKYHTLLRKLLKVDQSALDTCFQKKKVHELRSISIYNHLVMKQSDHSPSISDRNLLSDIEQYSRFLIYVSQCLLFSSALLVPPSDNVTSNRRRPQKDIHPFSFLFAISKVVDGELDGDRLDYTLRDCHEAGVNVAAFDIENLTSNSILVRNKIIELSSDQQLFAFGQYFRSMSSIEQFFESRYQSYKYLIFHRTSSRVNTCVGSLVAHILLYCTCFPETRISEIVSSFGFVEISETKEINAYLPNINKSIIRIDDSAFRTMLIKIASEIAKKDKKGDSSAANVELRRLIEDRINCLIEVVCFRNFANVITLFRDRAFFDVVCEIFPEIRRGIDEVSNNPFITPAQTSATIEDYNKIVNFINKWSEAISTSVNKKLLTNHPGLSIENGFVVHIKITPKVYSPIVAQYERKGHKPAFEEETWIRHGNGDLYPVAKLSPSLREMKTRVPWDSHIRVYFVGNNVRSLTVGEIAAVESAVVEEIRRMYNERSET